MPRVRYFARLSGSTNHNSCTVYPRGEHTLTAQSFPGYITSIVLKLQDAHFEAYIVGGALRDLLLGKVPKDFDVATNAPPRQITRLFPRARIIGRRFKIVHIQVKGGTIVEVTTFRSPSSTNFHTKFGSLVEDAGRRDFTCNSLYFNPRTWELLDFSTSYTDIKKHLLVPIIPLRTIFKEDPVRLVRAVKSSALLSLTPSFKLRRKIVRQRALLREVSQSRLSEELLKILSNEQCSMLLQTLIKFRLLPYITPELSKKITANPAFFSIFDSDVKALKTEYPDKAPRTLHLTALARPFIPVSALRSAKLSDRKCEAYKIFKSLFLPLALTNAFLEEALTILVKEHKAKAKKLGRRATRKQKTT